MIGNLALASPPVVNLLQHCVTLCALFVATTGFLVGFGYWRSSLGVVILDSVASPDEVRSLLEEMSPEQRDSHFAMTLWLDMAFPFVYGGLLAGIALRFLGPLSIWFALPAFLVIPVDLLENCIQLMSLSGDERLLFAKAFLTPLKFGLFFIALSIAIAALVKAAIAKLRARSSA